MLTPCRGSDAETCLSISYSHFPTTCLMLNDATAAAACSCAGEEAGCGGHRVFAAAIIASHFAAFLCAAECDGRVSFAAACSCAGEEAECDGHGDQGSHH
eukprot:1160228-Pelagomonas_calceolata.AAC.5